MNDPFLEDVICLIPKLRAYALVLTKSAADADDLVQDTLVRAWRYREGFQLGTNLKAWLFRILRNEFLTKARAARRTTEDVDGRHAAQLTCDPDQEFSLRYNELLKGIDKLSADTREALLLTVGAGLTYDEAAQACGCPVGTIKSRVSRARAFLTEYVDFEPPVRKRRVLVI